MTTAPDSLSHLHFLKFPAILYRFSVMVHTAIYMGTFKIKTKINYSFIVHLSPKDRLYLKNMEQLCKLARFAVERTTLPALDRCR